MQVKSPLKECLLGNIEASLFTKALTPTKKTKFTSEPHYPHISTSNH